MVVAGQQILRKSRSNGVFQSQHPILNVAANSCQNVSNLTDSPGPHLWPRLHCAKILRDCLLDHMAVSHGIRSRVKGFRAQFIPVKILNHEGPRRFNLDAGSLQLSRQQMGFVPQNMMGGQVVAMLISQLGRAQIWGYHCQNHI